ncbi:hypothetical protein IDG65_14650, partial [Staphylococcus sp. EG-SA-17]|nr:hypothetical protein [Staphylococcus sp. EG-SA-17]
MTFGSIVAILCALFVIFFIPYMEENVVMCGIVGYIGYDNAKELLLKGLEKLEYRGYDSAGIAV